MKHLARGQLFSFLLSCSTGRNGGLLPVLVVVAAIVVFAGHARAGTTSPSFLDTFSDDVIGQAPNGPEVGSYITMSPSGAHLVVDGGGSYLPAISGFTSRREIEFEIATDGLKQGWSSTCVCAAFVFPIPTRSLSGHRLEGPVTSFHHPRERVVVGSRKVQGSGEAGSNPMLPIQRHIEDD